MQGFLLSGLKSLIAGVIRMVRVALCFCCHSSCNFTCSGATTLEDLSDLKFELSEMFFYRYCNNSWWADTMLWEFSDVT